MASPVHVYIIVSTYSGHPKQFKIGLPCREGGIGDYYIFINNSLGLGQERNWPCMGPYLQSTFILQKRRIPSSICQIHFSWDD